MIMSIENLRLRIFKTKRILRNIRSIIFYPFWLVNRKKAPDNNFYKIIRLKKYINQLNINSLIETGTFYGQTVESIRKIVGQVISIEIFEPFYWANQEIFRPYKHVKIIYGDSGSQLERAIKLSNGKILFWLDGHYSGNGTGIGIKTSPIIEELLIIRNSGRLDSCIVIDDIRLFNGTDGYPTIEEAIKLIKSININYKIYQDCDCLIAHSQ